MRARYVIETSSWQLMAAESNFGNANELFAIGMSAARAGNATLAERARQALAERAHDPREGDLRPAVALMEREVAALVALAARRGEEAVGILQAAAQSEAQLPPPLACRNRSSRRRELLGEVLIELGRPAEAVDFFRQALRRMPIDRCQSSGLPGGRASGRCGGRAGALRQLLVNFSGADPELAVLAEARAALGQTGAPGVELTQRRRARRSSGGVRCGGSVSSPARVGC